MKKSSYKHSEGLRAEMADQQIDYNAMPYKAIVEQMEAYEHGNAEVTDIHPRMTLTMLRAVLSDTILCIHHGS